MFEKGKTGKIEKRYDEGAQYEWDRLDCHRTEFAVTLRAFKNYFPRPPAKILDIGGGLGRYAIALASQGYEVTLFDLSSRCLEFAKQKTKEAKTTIKAFKHGDAKDLSCFGDKGFDVVLLMGPLYHLTEETERLTAVHEAKRVLKLEGIIAASFVTRSAPIRYWAKNIPEQIIEKQERLKRLLNTGVLYGTGKGFPSAYFAHPLEIKPLFEKEGFKTLILLACEGVISMIEEKINNLTGEAWNMWVDLNYRLGTEPTVQGAAEHLLYIGKLSGG